MSNNKNQNFENLEGENPEGENFENMEITNKNVDMIQVKGSNNKAKVNPSSGIKKVAFVGVDDLILVVEGDSILVCNTHHSAEVKKVSQYFGD